jgi:hypothetical protein
MEDGNILSDKMSPHRKLLTFHLLVDSLFQYPYAKCIYTVMSSPSVSIFLFFGTFSIHMPYLCTYSIWFVSWKAQRQTWTKLIYYSTTLNPEAAGSSETLEPIYKITYLRKPQTKCSLPWDPPNSYKEESSAPSLINVKKISRQTYKIKLSNFTSGT